MGKRVQVGCQGGHQLPDLNCWPAGDYSKVCRTSLRAAGVLVASPLFAMSAAALLSAAVTLPLHIRRPASPARWASHRGPAAHPLLPTNHAFCPSPFSFPTQVIIAYTLGIAAMLMAFAAVPASMGWLQWATVFMIGFFLYGPQVRVGAGAPFFGRWEQQSRRLS